MNTDRSAWQPTKARVSSPRGGSSRSPLAVSSTLYTLQRKYRAALSGAVVAKARYLAQAGEAFATAISIERALWRWQRIEGCRARLAEEIFNLEMSAEFADRPQQRELRV